METKTIYEELEMLTIVFDAEDVIVTSEDALPPMDDIDV